MPEGKTFEFVPQGGMKVDNAASSCRASDAKFGCMYLKKAAGEVTNDACCKNTGELAVRMARAATNGGPIGTGDWPECALNA